MYDNVCFSFDFQLALSKCSSLLTFINKFFLLSCFCERVAGGLLMGLRKHKNDVCPNAYKREGDLTYYPRHCMCMGLYYLLYNVLPIHCN